MKNQNIINHILFWLLFTATFAISEWTYNHSFIDALTIELLFLPARIITVYINLFVLIPKYLYNNQLIKYIFFLLGILLIMAFVQRAFVLYIGYPIYFPEWMEGEHIHLLKPTKIVQNAMLIIIPLAFTTGWVLYIDLKHKQEQTIALEQQKTDAELKYLKSQINPHFLFNILNTIYGLTLENSKKAPDLILKLSDFLSFSLYESNQKLIPLEKEISLMNDFIALEKSRFEDRIILDMSIQENKKNIQIPPLILVPFVENALKHSLKHETDKAIISIKLNINDSQMLFFIKNSKPMNILKKDKENGGLGLLNIKKRLDIIYKNNYYLDIRNEASNYSVTLKIKLL